METNNNGFVAVTPKQCHKRLRRNAYVVKARQLSPNRFQAISGFDHENDTNFFDHPIDHIPGMLIATMVHQAAVAVTHIFYKVPMSAAGVFDDYHLTFHHYAELSPPLDILLDFNGDSMADEIRSTNFTFEVLQQETLICSGSGKFTLIYEKLSGTKFRSQLLNRLRLANAEQQRELMQIFVAEQISRQLGTPANSLYDLNQPLFELGFESLMMLALRQRFQVDLGVVLPAVSLAKRPGISQIAGELLDILKENGRLDPSYAVQETTSQSKSWIVNLQTGSSAKARLFCFHHMLGDALLFRDWSRYLPASYEICPVQLPGRLSDKGTPITQMDALVEKLADSLANMFDRPFAFFGHSMGALIAFELAHHLQKRALNNPFLIAASSAWSPAVHDEFIAHGSFSMDSPTILSGIPQDVREDAELMDELTRVFKADFTLLSSYRYSQKTLLNSPIVCFGGEEDTLVSRGDILKWGLLTHSSFKLQMFAGKHMFIADNRVPFLNALANELSTSISELEQTV